MFCLLRVFRLHEEGSGTESLHREYCAVFGVDFTSERERVGTEIVAGCFFMRTKAGPSGIVSSGGSETAGSVSSRSR